jgi:hypothetical protein
VKTKYGYALVAVAFLATACVEPRNIDGSGNNPQEPDLGKAGTVLARLVPAEYGPDGFGGEGRTGAREVSNALCADPGPIYNERRASDFVWQWGQFLDHDIDLSGESDPAESAPIPVPAGDPYFDPFETGSQEIPFHRSAWIPVDGVRQQTNLITAWIDASNVYGSDTARANALRTLDGSGRLETSEGDLLPFNVDGFPNAGGPSPHLFLAGDVRANEQVGLTALHTLFVREHNFLADMIREYAPELTGDEIYEAARAVVGAEMQVITYREFIPMLLGKRALSKYRGYDPEVDPSISNLFSTAAYRFGHSMVSRKLLRLGPDGQEIAEGHLQLRDSFFAPHYIVEADIAPVLLGLASQRAEYVDPKIVDELRNFLFGPPGSGGFDLAALNIQRGRDHGLPGYNAVRVGLGLGPAASFADVTSDPALQANLASVYDSPDEMDVWVGGLAEDHYRDALVGELVFTVLKGQFEALRDGDRLWYERHFEGRLLRWIKGQRLSNVIRRNTWIDGQISRNAFKTNKRSKHP